MMFYLDNLIQDVSDNELKKYLENKKIESENKFYELKNIENILIKNTFNEYNKYFINIKNNITFKNIITT
jgi:hypothetical protein